MRSNARQDSYAFVLWGESFREIPATIFVSELRRAGIRVKVVGLNAQRTTGQYGLKLTPDITLDQALQLAKRAICVIIPSDLEQLQQFDYDPRITELLHQAQMNDARIIIGRIPTTSEVQSQISAIPPKGMIEFPEAARLFEFVEQTAYALTHLGHNRSPVADFAN